jgi:hypothetical protein
VRSREPAADPLREFASCVWLRDVQLSASASPHLWPDAAIRERRCSQQPTSGT